MINICTYSVCVFLALGKPKPVLVFSIGFIVLTSWINFLSLGVKFSKNEEKYLLRITLTSVSLDITFLTSVNSSLNRWFSSCLSTLSFRNSSFSLKISLNSK